MKRVQYYIFKIEESRYFHIYINLELSVHKMMYMFCWLLFIRLRLIIVVIREMLLFIIVSSTCGVGTSFNEHAQNIGTQMFC